MQACCVSTAGRMHTALSVDSVRRLLTESRCQVFAVKAGQVQPEPRSGISPSAHLDILTCSRQVMAWAPGGVLSAYPSSFLHGKAAASGWAVVNAVGALMGGAQFSKPGDPFRAAHNRDLEQAFGSFGRLEMCTIHLLY